MHDSIDSGVALDMCSRIDVLVPVNLAERRMAGIDIGCVVKHGILIMQSDCEVAGSALLESEEVAALTSP